MTIREWLDSPVEDTRFGRTLAGMNRLGRFIEMWLYPIAMLLMGVLIGHLL